MAARFVPLIAGMLLAGSTVSAATAPDYSLGLPDRFVMNGLLIAAAAPDSSTEAEAVVVKDASEPRGFLREHPILGGTLVVLGIEALLALPSTAAYADENGRTLAAVDAVFGGLMLVTPDGGKGETIGGAVGVLALAGGVLAAANNGASQDQLFFLNWAGLHVAILGGRWIGSRFD